MKITIQVNGQPHATEVEPRRLLLDCLRDDLDLVGTKEGCGIGVCGACTVLVNGRLTSSCLELAVRCDGAEVLTIEGLSGEGLSGEGLLHPIQQAFIDHGGFQCGICTPGMILTAKALIERHRDPSDTQIDHAMMGSLCRCTGYYKIRDSVRAAAAAMRGLDGGAT